ncbi:MAG TPA: hypothetical protein VFM91_08900, partial [Propionibacteriaceae bacterium]|nr:hypothetical protein [Propionibacteriaceae bacterium]
AALVAGMKTHIGSACVSEHRQDRWTTPRECLSERRAITAPQERWSQPGTRTRQIKAFMSPPTRLAATAGINRYNPLPESTRRVTPATATKSVVVVLGEPLNVSSYAWFRHRTGTGPA